MTSFIGIIDQVMEVSLGTTLDADAASGSTILTVNDTSDFDGRTGGTVQINGSLYPYTDVDSDNELLTLGIGLSAAASQDDAVLIWDGTLGVVATEMRALVMIEDGADAQGDAMNALVTQSLRPMLPLGTREDGSGEVAECFVEEGECTLVDLPGVTPMLRGELLAPNSIPQVALGFTLPTGNHVTLGPTAPANPQDGDMWIYTDASNNANNKIFVWQASTTSWVTSMIGHDSIAPGSVTTDLLAAGAVVAGNIAAGALDAVSIRAGSLTAGSISSGNIGSSVLDSSDISDTRFILVPTDDQGGILLYSLTSQNTNTFTTSGSWTVPDGVTMMKVECWAAGGGGKASGVGANIGGTGAGGGEYSREDKYQVTPGQVIPYTIGAGGTSASGQNGTKGGDTSWNNGDILAHGGYGGGMTGASSTTGGAGSNDSVHYNGGAGAPVVGPNTTVTNYGGGGGSSAGPTKAGTPGNSQPGNTGGTAPSLGGNGGAGGTGSTSAAGTAGSPGAVPGGGGGGAGYGNTGAKLGGAGARGQIKITFSGNYTLVASIAGSAGVDDFGNSYPAGIKIAKAGGGWDKDWNIIGATGKPAYGTGWTPYVSGDYGPGARYYKDALGFVCIEGLATATAAATGNGNPAFTLPSGYRPLYRKIFTAFVTGGTEIVRISPSGAVYRDGSVAGNVSFDGIRFLAEA